MRKAAWIVVVVCGLASVPAAGLTVTFDADLGEWVGGDVVNMGTRPDPDGGTYTLLAAFDAANLYLGMDRSGTSRVLGDTGWDDDSFFVAFDVDGIIGSGATQDGYGRVGFGGDYLPDLFVYYAGGPHWYESSAWNGTDMEWLSWTEDGAVYGNPGWGGDDEFSIGLDRLGAADGEVMVWAWMTREGNGYVETSWPSGQTSSWSEETGTLAPVFGDGAIVAVPEPVTLVLLGFGAVAALRRKP